MQQGAQAGRTAAGVAAARTAATGIATAAPAAVFAAGKVGATGATLKGGAQIMRGAKVIGKAAGGGVIAGINLMGAGGALVGEVMLDQVRERRGSACLPPLVSVLGSIYIVLLSRC